MKKVEKIILSLMLIFTSLFFFGCSQVKLTTQLYSNGKITVTFEANLKDTPDNTKNTVYAIFKEYSKQLETAYQENMCKHFDRVYDFEAYNELDPQDKVDFIVAHNIEYSIGVTTEHSIVDVGGCKYFIATKDFASIYAYLMYFCPDAFTYDAELDKVKVRSDYHSLVDVPMPALEGNVEESGNMFISQYIQEFCPFYYNNEEPAFIYESTFASMHVQAGDKLVDVITDVCGEDTAEYFFEFLTPYKRLHSSGSVEITDKGYLHTWKLGGVNSKIQVWRNYANYVPWYGVAAVGGVVGLIVAFLIVHLISNRKKKKGIELLEKIDDFQQAKEGRKHVKQKKTKTGK